METREEKLGRMFAASSIPEVSKGGRSMLANARKKANRTVNLGRGVVYTPGTGEEFVSPEYKKAVQDQRAHDLEMLNARLSRKTPSDRRPRNLGNGIIMNEETGEYYQPEAYSAAQEAQNAARMNRAQVMRPPGQSDQPGQVAGFPIQGGQPTGGQEGKAREAYRLAQEADNLRRQVEQNPGALGTFADPALEFMRGDAKDPGFLSLFVPAAERFFYDPKDLKLRTSLARYEADLSKLAAGLAVTGFEMSDRKKWSPFAPGLSADQVQDRLDNLNKTLISQYYQAYGQGAPQTPPEAAAAPQLQDEEVVRRTYNGKNYIKQRGQWYEVD
jgi:hypothetical protein